MRKTELKANGFTIPFELKLYWLSEKRECLGIINVVQAKKKKKHYMLIDGTDANAIAHIVYNI